MSSYRDDLIFFAGLVAGAIVGGVVAAFLVPQSGITTRDQVVERGLELKGRAEDTVQRAQKVALETVAKVQSAAHEIMARGTISGADSSGGAGI